MQKKLKPLFIQNRYIFKINVPNDRDSYSRRKKEFIESIIYEAQNQIIRQRNKE